MQYDLYALQVSNAPRAVCHFGRDQAGSSSKPRQDQGPASQDNHKANAPRLILRNSSYPLQQYSQARRRPKEATRPAKASRNKPNERQQLLSYNRLRKSPSNRRPSQAKDERQDKHYTQRRLREPNGFSIRDRKDRFLPTSPKRFNQRLYRSEATCPHARQLRNQRWDKECNPSNLKRRHKVRHWVLGEGRRVRRPVNPFSVPSVHPFVPRTTGP